MKYCYGHANQTEKRESTSDIRMRIYLLETVDLMLKMNKNHDQWRSIPRITKTIIYRGSILNILSKYRSFFKVQTYFLNQLQI
jgi:hypothetical protein